VNGYSHVHVFPEAAKIFLAMAQSIVEVLPEQDDLRCHEVARVVAKWVSRRLSQIQVIEGIPGFGPVWPDEQPGGGKRMYVVDGSYGMPNGPRIEHSWLMTRFYCAEQQWWMVVLIDPYTVGRLPPVQMLDTGMELAGMYWGGPVRTDIRRDEIERLVVGAEAKLLG
jgi:hypothetical protein